MLRSFFLPTACKLCYWGRLALIAAVSEVIGAYTGTFLIALPFVLMAAGMAGLKWLVNHHS